MKFDKVKFLAAITDMRDAVFGKEEMKFTDAKLQDGTPIKYDTPTLAVGSNVTVATPQGDIAIPDGEYTLDDGTVITTAGGLVAEVSNAAEAKQDGTENPTAGAPPAMPAKPAAMTEANAKAIVESIIKETRFAEEIADLKTQIAEFKTVKESFVTQKEASEREVETIKTTIKELFTLVEKIAELPSENPAEKKKETFSVSAYKKAFKADLEKLIEKNN